MDAAVRFGRDSARAAVGSAFDRVVVFPARWWGSRVFGCARGGGGALSHGTSNMKPRLLDLFCGAGGAAMGYARAGFDVVGVDILPQPHYPFEFHQADAMTYPLEGFDAIHASPPCQGYSRMRHLPWLAGRVYPLLIDPIRDRLVAAGVPYIIENVEDSPLERRSNLFGAHGVMLCGSMFGLPLYRHRPFETSFSVIQPQHVPHERTIAPGRLLKDRGRVSTWERESRMPVVMGCPWMTQKEVAQAIPPDFTRYVGSALLASLGFDSVRAGAHSHTQTEPAK